MGYVQIDITYGAHKGYEDIPSDADLRNDLGEHGFSMARRKE
jgi:hypothetical protein